MNVSEFLNKHVVDDNKQSASKDLIDLLDESFDEGYKCGYYDGDEKGWIAHQEEDNN